MENIAIHGVVFVDGDEDKIIEILRRAKEIELPENLDSQIVNITEEDPQSSALIFSEGLPQNPVISQGSIEMIAVSVEDDGDISISVDLSPEFIDTAISLFENILDKHEIHFTDCDFDYVIDGEFNELDFDIKGPDGLEYHGVKLRKDEHEFIIQSEGTPPWENEEFGSTDDSETEDQEASSENVTSVSVMGSKHFDIEESGDFIRDRIENVEQTLELITP